MPHDRICQLRIARRAIEPPIWRRTQVPWAMTLGVHRVFQVVMGWTDSHLHEFVVRGQRYGQMSRDGGPCHGSRARAIPVASRGASDGGSVIPISQKVDWPIQIPT